MIIVNLLHISNIDNTYINTLDFGSIGNRDNYFSAKVQKTFTLNIKDNTILSSITLPINHAQIDHFNYLYITDENNNKLYYFIVNYDHKTNDSTILTIELDVFTTYQFNFTLLDSFIDRCHMPRWDGDNPIINTVEEPVALGEYYLETTDTICKYNNAIVVSSSQPLGKCPGFNSPSTGGNPGGGGGTNTSGSITKSGFRFIKGYEAFSPLGLYLNGESFKTVGYGSTERFNLDRYNEHKPFPCSEQKASEIFADRIINEFGKTLYDRLVKDNIKDKINLNMFDAMVSTCYNCGSYAFLDDETSPYQFIKKDPFDKNIKSVWENFYTMGGDPLVQLPGLVLRRKAEVDIYLNKVYEMRSILIYKDGGGLVGVPGGVVEENRGDGFIPAYLPDFKNTLEIIEEV